MPAVLGASRRWTVVIALALGLSAAGCLTPVSPWGSLALAFLWLLPVCVAGGIHWLFALSTWLFASGGLLAHFHLSDAGDISQLFFEPTVVGPIFFLAVAAILSFRAFYIDKPADVVSSTVQSPGSTARIHRWEFPRAAETQENASAVAQEPAPTIGLPDRLDILQRASHELTGRANNTLGSIRAALDILDHRIGSHSELATFSELAQHELSHLDAAFKAFNVLTAPPQITGRGSEPNAPIVHALESARAQFPSIHFQAELDPDTPSISLNSQAIEQAVFELLKNAAEAMAGHGMVKIESYRRGRNCVIAVSDSGAGIAPANRDSVFLPFFTTRPGRLGMGLAICHKLVKDVVGNIALTTREGQGTTVKLLLPAVAQVKTGNAPEYTQ